MTDVLDIVSKEQRLALLKQKLRLKQENALAFYNPHRKQDLFHRAGNYKRRYVRSGNRFGKSEMGAAEDLAFSVGERPWYPEDDPARFIGIPKHPTKGCIVVADWDKAEEIFTNLTPGKSQGKLITLMPKFAEAQYKRGRSGTGIAEISLKSIWGGRSTIHIETVRSFMQNRMGLESSNWDWIHIDEPCPEEMWKAMARGLIDRSGSAWFTCTPLTEAWINDYFIPRSRTRDMFDDPYVNEDKKLKKWVVTGSSYDNPFVPKAEIENFAGELSAAEIQTRINGIPAAFSGLIYKNFKHDKHVYRNTPFGWESAQQPPKDYTIRVFIDPHPKTPHAVLYFATSPHGYTYIYQELFRPCLISELVELVQAQTEGYRVEDYIVDPLAFVENPNTGACMADEFYAHGLYVIPAPKDLAYGLIKTDQAWNQYDKDGFPYIRVHENCEEFLYEIDRYIWQDKKEKPVDRDDHMMECLYRAVLTGLHYVNPDYVVPKFVPMQVKMPKLESTKNLASLEPAQRALPITKGRYRF
jgi:hypothetical protein